MFEQLITFLKPQLKPAIREFETEVSEEMQQLQTKVNGQFVFILVRKEQKVLVIPASIDEQGRINYKNMPVKAKYLSDILFEATKNL